MSWAGRRFGAASRGSLWLGRSFAALQTSAANGVTAVLGLGSAEEGVAWIGSSLDGSQPGQQPRQWTLRLGCGLARPFVFRPPAGLKSRQELLAVARAVVEDEVGMPADSAIWAGAEEADGSTIVVVVDKNGLLSLGQELLGRGGLLRSVRPAWAELTDPGGTADVAQPEMLFAEDPDGATVLAADHGRWLWAESTPRASTPDEHDAWLTRIAIRLGWSDRDVPRYRLDHRTLAWVGMDQHKDAA